jgi:bacterioferritin (cytochrome b1)
MQLSCRTDWYIELERPAGEKDMVDIQSESLNSVLRSEMTAVNQQFIHVLALRDWSYHTAAERIMQVDRIDFPNAMRIIDYLVETEAPLLLNSDRFTPGANYRSILVSEQAMEQQLLAAIGRAACTNPRASALISAAEGPREAYAAWLADQLNGPSDEEHSANLPVAETSGIFAHLIAMIEQAMVHAFVHWHRGDADNADAAWATSGAAMMHATNFVHFFAAHRTVPVPREIPTLQIAGDPVVALEFDRQAAERCASEAATASRTCHEPTLAELCRRISNYALELSAWSPKRTHPAATSNPAAFSSFKATLSKYVWPRESTA